MAYFKRLLVTTAACLLLASSPPFVGPATAGCGCDHPPPDWAMVMPPFAAGGRDLLLHAVDGEFQVGSEYSVSFRADFTNRSRWIETVAVAGSADALRVTVPSRGKAGPTKIRVAGPGYDHVYPSEFFTKLALPRRVPSGDSVIVIDGYVASVTQDGTILIAMDLTDVTDPTQFAFVWMASPVRFSSSDVVFYNEDGVDLTLFTLMVDDPTERQWGSYYGWDVETDAGIVDTIFDTKVVDSIDPGSQSDMLTYWRHEFESYAAAHAPGGTHEVNDAGYHPDGSWHVDHDLLVIAIAPGDNIAPGQLVGDLLVTAVVSDNPVEPEEMQARANGSTLYVEEAARQTNREANRSGETDSITLDSTGTLEEAATTTTTEATSTETTRRKGGKRSRR